LVKAGEARGEETQEEKLPGGFPFKQATSRETPKIGLAMLPLH